MFTVALWWGRPLDFTLVPAKLLWEETSLQWAQTVNIIGEHKCKQKDLNNENKEMLTITSELKMLTEKSHLCYPRCLTRLHLSSQKALDTPLQSKSYLIFYFLKCSFLFRNFRGQFIIRGVSKVRLIIWGVWENCLRSAPLNEKSRSFPPWDYRIAFRNFRQCFINFACFFFLRHPV